MSDEVDAALGAEMARQWARRDRGANVANAVRETLRRLIVSGLLKPGHRLAEEELARRFTVSRTPVREALLLLEAERLAERRAGRSLVVAGVTADEILEVYAVRVAMDGLAARLAAESARPRDVEHLRWLHDRLRDAGKHGDGPRMAAVNLEVHEAIARAGRNAFLSELLDTVHDRVRRFPGTTFSDAARASRAIDEHARIIDAIERRDADAAEHLARAHMADAMAVRIRLLRDDR